MNGPFLGHDDLKKCPKYRTLGFKDYKVQKLLGPLEVIGFPVYLYM